MELEDLLHLIEAHSVTVHHDGRLITFNGKLTYEDILSIPIKIRHREVSDIVVDDEGKVRIRLWEH